MEGGVVQNLENINLKKYDIMEDQKTKILELEKSLLRKQQVTLQLAVSSILLAVDRTLKNLPQILNLGFI